MASEYETEAEYWRRIGRANLVVLPVVTTFKTDPYQPRDRIGTIDERCANCRQPLDAHYNGKCPEDENAETIKKP